MVRAQPQVPQAQCEHDRRKYKDLFGNPDKKLQKINIWKPSQLKSLTLLPTWVTSFLCGYFPDPTRFEPFLNFVVVNGYNKLPRLKTKFSGATNLSQIFLDKMFPRSQFHITINWQRLNFHLKYFKQEPIQRRFDFSDVLYFGWPNQPSSGTMRVYIELLLCTYIYIYSKWMLT